MFKRLLYLMFALLTLTISLQAAVVPAKKAIAASIQETPADDDAPKKPKKRSRAHQEEEDQISGSKKHRVATPDPKEAKPASTTVATLAIQELLDFDDDNDESKEEAQPADAEEPKAPILLTMMQALYANWEIYASGEVFSRIEFMNEFLDTISEVSVDDVKAAFTAVVNQYEDIRKKTYFRTYEMVKGDKQHLSVELLTPEDHYYQTKVCAAPGNWQSHYKMLLLFILHKKTALIIRNDSELFTGAKEFLKRQDIFDTILYDDTDDTIAESSIALNPSYAFLVKLIMENAVRLSTDYNIKMTNFGLWHLYVSEEKAHNDEVLTLLHAHPVTSRELTPEATLNFFTALISEGDKVLTEYIQTSAVRKIIGVQNVKHLRRLKVSKNL